MKPLFVMITSPLGAHVQPRSARKKRVRFGDVSVGVASAKSSSCGEAKRCRWYTREEFKFIRQTIRHTIKGKIAVDECQESWRGLEYMADKIRRMERKMKIQLVLELQEDNRTTGIPCCQGLRQLSLQLSKQDTHCSVVSAAKDSLNANQIYKETLKAAIVDPCFL
ncbi:expressed unknown protein [Seminavis robusta]|uniref:Uncharacterized protein n=1 Tax=Seminavis robusta TaxID=568900 RepID=A0A9N8HWP8_9STRA|nr:expressed unknown protein [Seminavis robusta]|eukprot:Sro2235_g320190.1 n/a (166) ;mRNA; r:9194-9879